MNFAGRDRTAPFTAVAASGRREREKDHEMPGTRPTLLEI